MRYIYFRAGGAVTLTSMFGRAGGATTTAGGDTITAGVETFTAAGVTITSDF